MEKLKDLKALLIHEVQDVYSAEEQIMKALPDMIEYATNAQLKASLNEHLKITRKQVQRLDKVQKLLKVAEDERGTAKKGGLLGIFGTTHKCKGMEGIISEGNSILSEDINTEVLDAAIIASCQKIEHYEICAYGTLRAYAKELGLSQVVKLLEETLEEEYEADVLLTQLAVFGGVNHEAEGQNTKNPGAVAETESRGSVSRSASPATSSRSASSPSRKTATAKKSSASKSSARSATVKKSAATGKAARSSR